MDDETGQTVTVTHFINPHLFWYRKVGTPGDDYVHVLAEAEGKLQDLYRNKPLMETRCRPTIGDKVAVNFVPWNKFIRAEVLQTAEFKQEEFVVWTIDYGFPLVTKKEHVRRLPESLTFPVTQVHRGGVANVQPAEVEYDHVESNLVMVKQEQWLQKACEMLEKLLADATTIVFHEHYRTCDDHRWGNLVIVSHKGHTFNASTYLQTAKYAMEVGPEFPQACLKYKTTKIAPWLTNNRKTNMKYNSIKSNMMEHTLQVTTASIDERAKRKVEDWCARNERQHKSNICDVHAESVTESIPDQSIDDITFDDSVSVIARKANEKEQTPKSMHSNRRHHEHDKIYFENVEQLKDVEQINYIGKAGALTKLKQQKYSSKNNLPPQVQMDAFNIEPAGNSTTFSVQSSTSDQTAATEMSSNSSSSSMSVRMQKLAETRAKHARETLNTKNANEAQLLESGTSFSSASNTDGGNTSLLIQKIREIRKKCAQAEKDKQLADTDSQPIRQDVCVPNLNASNVSACSSETRHSTVSSRMQKMFELRKKYIRADVERQLDTPDGSKCAESKNNKNVTESCTSLEGHSINNQSDMFAYQPLDQSLTFTTGIDSNLDKTQDSRSELSVKNVRAKHLSALRSKINQQPLKSSGNCDANNTGLNTTDSTLAVTSSKYMDNLKKIKDLKISQEENLTDSHVFSFKLKPKAVTANESQNCAAETLTLPPMTSSKEQEKQNQAAYEGLTLVPAGFDIARLQNYRDEQNHWHRKKTTRYDHVPHDVSSSEELLLNPNDQSSSSSDFFQIKPPKPKIKATMPERFMRPLRKNEAKTNYNHMHERNQNIMDLSIPSDCDSSAVQPHAYGFDGDLPRKISTSSTTTSTMKSDSSQNRKQRRELKSPTSQISKIDEILKQYSMEQEPGDNNSILDLKRLSISPSKPQRNCDRVTEATTSSTDTIVSNTCGVATENHGVGRVPTTPDKYRNEKHLKNVSNYTTLMEVKHTEQLPIVEGEIAMQTRFIDHSVLAHSSIPLCPIENVAEASFLPEIHEEMRHMRINKVYRIQVYSWTHLLRGNSLFVVNPSRTGKTWSYLPALCSLVCYRSGRMSRATYGPIALILVASSRHVESVNGCCRRLMSGLKSEAPTCVPSYGMRNFIDTKVQLLSGCGILIATPSSLLRLLQDNEREPLLDWERLQHIVIDDMDLILSRSHEDFESAIRIVFKMAKKSKFKTLQPQLVVTSRDWDGLMIRVLRKSNQPLLLIGDFLEAAVYGRATLSVKLNSSQEKNETIRRFLKQQTQCLQGDLSFKRLLIMCNSDEDVEVLMQFLTECGYPCLAYYNRSTEGEKATVDEWKNKVSSQILICTDARFPELEIQNVKHLIHYSMPTSWTQFTTRFSALAQTYENFVCKNFVETREHSSSTSANRTEENNTSAPHSMILLDEENSLQLPRLVDFMRKHNQCVHPDILSVSKRVLVAREESRIFKGALLCPQLMEFGECDDARCDNRHELTRYDVIGENEDLPYAGEMRIHILKVFSPTHYSARVLKHKPPQGKKWLEVRRSREALTFAMQLDLHYRDDNNLALHWPPHINDLCVYKYADHFRRARVLDAPALSGKNTNVVESKLKVKLRLIDEGTIISDIKCTEIYVCDDKFKDFPSQAVDIRLMGIVPFDNERTWDSKTTKQVQNWIMDDIKSNHVVHVVVNFALANTVWVKNVVVMEELSTLGTYRQFVNLKMSLVQKNFALVYRGERKHIRDIAEEYGLLKTSSSSAMQHNDNELEISMEDDDYQSCQNESSDLIKFSSSNGEEETSANNSIQSVKNDSTSDEFKVQKEKCQKEQTTSVKATSESKEDPINDEEENWDNVGNEQRNEVYVPLNREFPSVTTEPKAPASAHPSIIAPSPDPKQESWGQLCLNELTKVEIGDEGENGNWENIFLQIIDRKHMQTFDDLEELINEHVSRQKVIQTNSKRNYDFEPLHNCIVKYNKIYLRAKVHGVFGANVKARLYRFFLCDYACFANVKSSDLYNDCFYETTDEIVQFTPYQSVHCTLAGIHWDRFTKRYQVTKEYLYACAMEERDEKEKKALHLYNLPIRSYKILLFECEKDGEFAKAEMFNKTLLDVGITTTDEATKHYLDYALDIAAPKSDEYIEEINRASSSEDEVYTFEQLLTCIQQSQQQDDVENTLLQETTKVLKDIKVPEKDQSLKEVSGGAVVKSEAIPSGMKKDIKEYKPEIDDDEEDHCTSDSDSNKKSSRSLTSSSNGNSETAEPIPPMRALNKRPPTTWYETDCVVYLSIYAPDITDYVIQVQPKKIFFSTQIENEFYVLNLNLMGSVVPEKVSHEIKGLNVVVRLVKNVLMKWPRLLEESTKYSWLKYNYSCFDAAELACIVPQQQLQAVLENSPHFNTSNIHDDFDSEDSERDKFETYNRIENNDDCYDPFS